MASSLCCVTLLSLVAAGFSLPMQIPQVHASGPFVLDGVGNGVGSSTICGTYCRAESLTTAHGHDLIILIVECGFTSCLSTISTITDSSGLNFTQRVSFASNDKIWEYYARATSPLKSDNISVVLPGIFTWGMQVLAIHVANTRAIFDQSPRFPITLSCLGPGGVSVTTCSASIGAVAHEFVIASTAINDAGACTPSSGFTELGGGGGDGVLDIDYQIVSTPHDNLVFTCKDSDPVAMVVDAISIPSALGTSQN